MAHLHPPHPPRQSRQTTKTRTYLYNFVKNAATVPRPLLFEDRGCSAEDEEEGGPLEDDDEGKGKAAATDDEDASPPPLMCPDDDAKPVSGDMLDRDPAAIELAVWEALIRARADRVSGLIRSVMDDVESWWTLLEEGGVFRKARVSWEVSGVVIMGEAALLPSPLLLMMMLLLAMSWTKLLDGLELGSSTIRGWLLFMWSVIYMQVSVFLECVLSGVRVVSCPSGNAM